MNGDEDVGLILPAQESYTEAQQQNAQPLHYLPAGTNILALCLISMSRFHDTANSFVVCVVYRRVDGCLLLA